MKTFVIEERYTGYCDITIRAESEEEAKRKYELGQYDIDDMFYDYQFNSIREEK